MKSLSIKGVSLIISEVLVNLLGSKPRCGRGVHAADAKSDDQCDVKREAASPPTSSPSDDLPCKPLHSAKILYEKRNPTYILNILLAIILQPDLSVSHPREESINIYSAAKIDIQPPVWDFISKTPYVLRVPDFSSITSATMTRQVSSTSEMIDYFIAFFLPPVSPPPSSHTGLVGQDLGQLADVCPTALPQVGVFLKRGCHADLFINILLTILGWIPGVIHAWWVIG